MSASMSTGFAGAESGDVRIGDVVAIFAQGPIGLCAHDPFAQQRDGVLEVAITPSPGSLAIRVAR